MSDRRYTQRGYMDNEPRPRRQSTPKPQHEGPRGRGLGAPTKEVFRCRDCGQEVEASTWTESRRIDLDASCSKCDADLHSCVNCSQFDTSERFECRQPIEERVASKTQRNRCELFAAKITMERESDTTGPAPSAGRAAFDALFD